MPLGVDQHVLGLQIAVNDVVLVQVVESHCDLPDPEACGLLAESFLVFGGRVGFGGGFVGGAGVGTGALGVGLAELLGGVGGQGARRLVGPAVLDLALRIALVVGVVALMMRRLFVGAGAPVILDQMPRKSFQSLICLSTWLLTFSSHCFLVTTWKLEGESQGDDEGIVHGSDDAALRACVDNLLALHQSLLL